MESGLEDRNNSRWRSRSLACRSFGLNGVRPRRPEQFGQWREQREQGRWVSMESGLEDRNNIPPSSPNYPGNHRLNGVRPRRPEQFSKFKASPRAAASSQWSPA